MGGNGLGGTARITSDGAIGPSGKKIRLFSITIISGAGGGGIVAFHNGTSASGDMYAQGSGTASTGVTINFTQGRLFPSGCYANIDANTSAVVASYITEA